MVIFLLPSDSFTTSCHKYQELLGHSQHFLPMPDLRSKKDEDSTTDSEFKRSPASKHKDKKFVSSDGQIREESLRIVPYKFRSAAFRKLHDDIKDVRRSMEKKGILPELVGQGSSGSYFCRATCNGPMVGIFKPRDEEPYGPHNPKVRKAIQRALFPCCFGRACLLQNQGYISEASASVVDHMLQLHIVPETVVTSFASPAFNYKGIVTALARCHLGMLPRKVGSFQKFVHDAKPASSFTEIEFQKFMQDKDFIVQFQKLTILDYLIRNTDRGLDNFLIHFGAFEKPLLSAIDNGLSFPFKHPDTFRVYPYGWSNLSACHQPYDKELADIVLPLLTSFEWRRRLKKALRRIMRQDPLFKKRAFRDQMAVIRGQIANLVDVLENQFSPFDLVNMPPYAIYEEPKSGVEILRIRAKFACCPC